MVEHIEEILKTGDYSLRAKLLKKFPVTLLDILNLQSLGPKKVAFLWSNFQAATVADVEKLAKDDAGRMGAAFRLALGREPTAKERDALVNYVKEHGLANGCRVILNLNEFVFVD